MVLCESFAIKYYLSSRTRRRCNLRLACCSPSCRRSCSGFFSLTLSRASVRHPTAQCIAYPGRRDPPGDRQGGACAGGSRCDAASAPEVAGDRLLPGASDDARSIPVRRYDRWIHVDTSGQRAAAEFSFFLAIPTMLGAFVLDAIQSRDQLLAAGRLDLLGLGLVIAFLVALVVIRGCLPSYGRACTIGWIKCEGCAGL